MKDTKKLKVLFMVLAPFHNNVGNAGSKTINYYFGCFCKDNCFEVALAFLGDKSNDYDKMVMQHQTIKIFSVFKVKSIAEKLYDRFRFRIWYPFIKNINPSYYITDAFTKNRIRRALKNVKESGFKPDVVVAEQTKIIFWIDVIKTIFPSALTIASCHDVTYLSVKRYLSSARKRYIYGDFYFKWFKNMEIRRLNNFDIVITHNVKDKDLLKVEEKYVNTNTHVIVPYYDVYKLISGTVKDGIVFFGAMARVENTDAAEWFLYNVWPELNRCFNGAIKFIIVGGGLSEDKKEKYLKYPNVLLTGFVANPVQVFSRAVCFVAPLRLGAGIKVKVLEAMSAGIPVVTNSVGIEGIAALPGIDYLQSNSAGEYIDNIIRLVDDAALRAKVSANARSIMERDFNIEASYHNYKTLLLNTLK